MTFLSLFRRLSYQVYEWDEDDNGPIPEDALDSLVEQFSLIGVYGTEATEASAKRVLDWLAAETFGNKREGHDAARDGLVDDYIQWVRRDLAVPGTISPPAAQG